jgi:hypothetical protein
MRKVLQVAKNTTIREVEDGSEAALLRALKGRVCDRAVFEPFALPLLVDGLLHEMGIEAPYGKMVHSGLVRQALFVGPGERGWISTIELILDAYQRVWGDVIPLSGFNSFLELENHGFRYDDYRDSVLCLELIKSGIQSEPRLEDDEELQEIINHNKPPISSVEELQLRTFAVFLHHVARCAGWACNGKRTSRRPSSPLSEPWVPMVVIVHGLRNMKTVNCGNCQDLHFTEIWNKAMCGHRMGLTWSSISWIMEQPAFRMSLVDFLKLAHSKGFSQELLIEVQTLGEVALRENSLLDLVNVACTWSQMDRPGTLRRFLEIGGTRGAYETHRQAREEEEQERRLTDRAESEARRASSAPTGRKRGQGNAPEPEQVDVDFSAMCAELDVAAHFTGLDQGTTRVILIHGLLRDGERLASMASRPERDEKKLWRQCRDHLAAGVSRRVFKSAVRALVTNHVASVSGGKYKLARKNHRWPQAHAVLVQLSSLMAKHSC